MTCECKDCNFCGGRGYFYRNIDGSFSEYHTDDMQEEEYCDECNGTGIEEICDECWETYCGWEEEGYA